LEVLPYCDREDWLIGGETEELESDAEGAIWIDGAEESIKYLEERCGVYWDGWLAVVGVCVGEDGAIETVVGYCCVAVIDGKICSEAIL
jgi:hypothetical protein